MVTRERKTGDGGGAKCASICQMVLLMVLMASAGSVTVGAVTWSTEGLNDKALMFILFGGE